MACPLFIRYLPRSINDVSLHMPRSRASQPSIHRRMNRESQRKRDRERERVKGNEEAEDGQRKRGLFVLYCELGAAAAAANLKRYKNLMLASFLLSHLFQRGGRDRSSSSSCPLTRGEGRGRAKWSRIDGTILWRDGRVSRGYKQK